nr:hypothetical protein [Halobaculum saliterrae]
MLDDLLVGERAHRIRAVPVLSEALDVDGVLTEEVVAGGHAHRDRVRPPRQPDFEAVEHHVHMDLAAAPVAPDLAEHHVAERCPVDSLLAKDLFQGPVHIHRVDDRVTVCGDVK